MFKAFFGAFIYLCAQLSENLGCRSLLGVLFLWGVDEGTGRYGRNILQLWDWFIKKTKYQQNNKVMKQKNEKSVFVPSEHVSVAMEIVGFPWKRWLRFEIQNLWTWFFKSKWIRVAVNVPTTMSLSSNTPMRWHHSFRESPSIYCTVFFLFPFSILRVQILQSNKSVVSAVSGRVISWIFAFFWSLW